MAEIIRRGTWLYNGTLPAEVVILKYLDADIPRLGADDDRDPEYPPRDAEGFFYGVEYYALGHGTRLKGVSGWLFASASEAIQHAERTLKYPITWKDNL